MTNRKDGGAAFPFQELSDDGSHFHSHSGISLRDWFAGKALSAMEMPNDGEYSAHDHIAGGRAHMDAKWRASAAYRIADEMLAEREKAGSDEK